MKFVNRFLIFCAIAAIASRYTEISRESGRRSQQDYSFLWFSTFQHRDYFGNTTFKSYRLFMTVQILYLIFNAKAIEQLNQNPEN